ncbi:MAG: UbiA prenyltransferase family protein [Planctomycetota bacterium]
MNDISPQIDGQDSRGGLWNLLEAMRPQHWVKNAFVAAPILFSGRFNEVETWGRCLAAVASFCLLSSSVYLINDICDRKSDRAHPIKSRRPIASGRLSVTRAVWAAAVLVLLGLGLVLVVEVFSFDRSQPLFGLGLLVWTVVYLVLNLFYSFWLKAHMIVDVLAVAMCFVLRAMAGAAAISVPISPWLVLCTLTLCLFIALSKRRSEIAELPEGQIGEVRRASTAYDKDMLDHMLTVSAGLAILTYSLYCLAPRTVDHIGSGHMIWTIPLVIYGTFRYYRLTSGHTGSDPVVVLIHDKIMWLVLITYAVLSAAIIKFGWHPSIRNILDIAESGGG